MDQAVQDGVSDGRVRDVGMPLVYRELAGDDGGPGLAAVVDDLQQVPAVGGGQRADPPVIQREYLRSGQASQQARVRTVAPGGRQIGQQPRKAVVPGAVFMPTSGLSQGAGDKGFAHPGGSGDQDVLVRGDPMAGGQTVHD